MGLDHRTFSSRRLVTTGGVFFLLLLLAPAAPAAGPATQPWQWQEFAILRRSEHREPVFWCEIFRDAGAAYPLHCSMPPAADKADIAQNFQLRLSLKKGWFIIQTRNNRKLLDWPDWFLLSRWWVNGKAVVPPHKEPIPRVLGRVIVTTTKMRVKFGWPDDLGVLHAGDKVALQVLYAPDGYDRDPFLESMLRNGQNPLPSTRPKRPTTKPLLSNPIEFIVTPQRLAAHGNGKP